MTQTEDIKMVVAHDRQKKPAYNSTNPKGGVSSPLDSFVVVESSVLRTCFCAEKRAHWQSAKHQALKKHLPSFMLSNSTIF